MIATTTITKQMITANGVKFPSLYFANSTRHSNRISLYNSYNFWLISFLIKTNIICDS